MTYVLDKLYSTHHQEIALSFNRVQPLSSGVQLLPELFLFQLTALCQPLLVPLRLQEDLLGLQHSLIVLPPSDRDEFLHASRLLLANVLLLQQGCFHSFGTGGRLCTNVCCVLCMCVCAYVHVHVCMCVKCVGPNVVSTCIAGCTCMCRCDKLCTSVHEQIVYVQNTCEQVKWKLQFNSQVIPFTMAVHPTCIEGSLSVPKFSLHPRHLLHQLIPLALQGMHPLLQKCQLLAQDHLLSLQSSQPLLQHSHTSTI